jgi:hypothetical protein
MLLLFARWKHARTLAMVINGLQLVFGLMVLCFAWKYGNPVMGYSLTTVLHLLVLKVLNDSISVHEYLAQKPTDN